MATKSLHIRVERLEEETPPGVCGHCLMVARVLALPAPTEPCRHQPLNYEDMLAGYVNSREDPVAEVPLDQSQPSPSVR